jgi:universal stress protein A
MSPLEIARILVPTDFSAPSEKAVRYGVELARVFSSEIVLLHVLDTRVVDNIYHIHELSPERARAEMRRSAEKAMAALVAADWAEGVRIVTRFVEGLPPIAVKEVAEEVKADLVVMGTHGRTGITQLLYGSTAEGVVRGAPCPVLTVNP